MTFTPAIFADLGKNVTDLFKQKKYTFGQALEVKHSSPEFETTTKADVKNGASLTDVTTKYVNKKFGSVEVTADSNKKLASKLIVTSIDSVKLTVDVEQRKDRTCGAVEAKYVKDAVAAVASVDCCKIAQLSAVVGFDGLSVGGAIKLDGNQSAIADYNAGVQYSKDDFAVTVKTANMFDSVSFQIANQVNPWAFLGAELTYNLASEDRKFQFGGQYTLDKDTTVKAKVTQDGQVSVVWQNQINRNVSLALGVDSNDSFTNTAAGFKVCISA